MRNYVGGQVDGGGKGMFRRGKDNPSCLQDLQHRTSRFLMTERTQYNKEHLGSRTLGY